MSRTMQADNPSLAGPAWLRPVYLNLAVALAYWLSGYVLLQLFSDAHAANFIWPATGVGIGCCLLWGRTVLPALLAVELYWHMQLLGPLVDAEDWRRAIFLAALSLSAVLRSVLAAWLIRTLTNRPFHLIRFRNIARVFLLAGPLAIAIASLIHVSLLTALRADGWSQFLGDLFRWWTGNVTGFMLFTPVVLILFAKPRSIWRPRMLAVAVPLMLGFVLFMWLFNAVQNHQNNWLYATLKHKLNVLEQRLILHQKDESLEQLLSQYEREFALECCVLQVLDASTDPPQTVYVSARNSASPGFSVFQQRRRVESAGQALLLELTPTRAFYMNEAAWTAWWMVSFGLLFTSLLGTGLLALTGRNALTEEEVNKRTAELNKANRALAESNASYQNLIETQPVIFWRMNQKTRQFTYVSKEAESILGYPVAQWLNERNFLLNHVHEDDVDLVMESMAERARQRGNIEAEYRVLTQDGGTKWFRDVVNATDPQNSADETVGLMIDITEKKRNELKIRQLAYHDYLTGLPNRQYLQEKLARLYSMAAAEQTHGAVIFLDLDRFKLLNDSLGHHCGDQLLKQIARRLSSFKYDCDMIARFGGDEFVVLMNNDYASKQDAEIHAIAMATEIKNQLKKPFVINDLQHECNASIGISVYPENGKTPRDVLQQADTAMYRAKAQGRNQVALFHASMKQDDDTKFYIEQSLRNSISNGELQLYYQPIVDAQRRVIARESLLRWHNKGDTLLPDRFIPIAEETDLIYTIGQWVIRSACEKSCTGDELISINVSSKQFHDHDFIDKISDTIGAERFRSARLIIELTEGVAIDNIDETIHKLTQLKSMGMGIAIDDFGTGYSSLEYLWRMPIDYVKIDKTFIRNLGKQDSARIIVETIVSMAGHLNLKVIAEGVENEQQYEALRNMGCEYFQGFLFGKPQPA